MTKERVDIGEIRFRIILCIAIVLFIGFFGILMMNSINHSNYNYEKICSKEDLDWGYNCVISQNSLNLFDVPKAITFSELLDGTNPKELSKLEDEEVKK
jgi:hypothetical protein